MKYLDLHLKKDLIRQTSFYQKKQDPNGNGKLKEKVEKMGGDLQLGSMESRNGAPKALNQTDVPGYHNKNRNGAANGTGKLEGKGPTPSAGHLTAPKTKTLIN